MITISKTAMAWNNTLILISFWDQFLLKVSPYASSIEVKTNYNLDLINKIKMKFYDGIVLAVSHNEFLTLDYDLMLKDNGIIYDVKGFLGDVADGSL